VKFPGQRLAVVTFRDPLARRVVIRRWLLEAGVEGELLRDDQWERLREFVPD
jgi:hypothetical protein